MNEKSTQIQHEFCQPLNWVSARVINMHIP